MQPNKMNRVGTGCQVAGVMGVLAALFLGYDLSKHPQEGYTGEQLQKCYNNLQGISFAFRIWANGHHDQFPFNVSTNAGGTRELCVRDGEGFDSNAALHFQVLSNELLGDTSILVCPNDSTRKAAPDFRSLRRANISYRLRTGTNVNEDNPNAVLAVCPIDGNLLYWGGDVKFVVERADAPPPFADMRHNSARFRRAVKQVLASLAAAILLFAAGSRLKRKGWPA